MRRHLAACLLLPLCISLLPAQIPQVVRGPYLQVGTATSIHVRWRTNLPTQGRVRFGPAPGALTNLVDQPQSTTEHEVVLSGLVPETLYFYSVGLPGTVLAGDDPNHHFRTAPPPGSRRSFRLWAIGDSGTHNQNARSVRDGYLLWNGSHRTDLWLMLGDNAYNSGTDSQYQIAVFQNMYETLLRTVPLWTTFGNHDALNASSTGQSGPYFDIFSLPTAGEAGGLPSGTEAYYAFDYANVHFVCLDSADSDLSAGGAMATWLQADLSSTAQEWIIAYWHHPPYSKGSHDSDTAPRMIAMRQNFLPIIEAQGVDLVLGGHSHVYERSMLIDGHYGFSSSFNPATMAVDPGDGDPSGTGAYRKAGTGTAAHQGTVYVVDGSSGVFSLFGTFNHPVMVHSNPRLGSVVLDVNGLQLDLRSLDEHGLVKDHFTLVKGGVTPVNLVHHPVPTGAVWSFEDSGTNLGTAWRNPGFNAQAWASGPAPLGYGVSSVATTVSFGNNPLNTHPTTYLRKNFNLNVDPGQVENLRALVNYDDGFVLYLNGQEVARRSLPAGPVAFATYASSHEAGTFEVLDLSPFMGLLLPGPNLLAVEVHQDTPASPDLFFDMALSVDAFEPLLGPCGAGTLGESLLRLNGSDGGFGRSVDQKASDPLTISLATPSTNPGGSLFMLFVTLGTPTAQDAFPLPLPMGTLCFPPAPLFPANSNLLTLASSYAAGPQSLIQAGPAPWSWTLGGGLLPVGLQLSFQPVMEQTPGNLKVGNAVRLVVRP